MYLSDLCSERNAIYTVFMRFPQLHPPETKTNMDAIAIAHNLLMFCITFSIFPKELQNIYI